MTRGRWLAAAGLATVAVAAPHAQTIPPARVAVLQADERGAPDARDLATLRAGIRNADGETARAAIRALGRLGRPALVPDIAVALKSSLPELRAEAANAIASSLSTAAASASADGRSQQAGARPAASSSAAIVATALSTLLSRLAVETEPGVRAAICEALGRIPYSDTSQITRAEGALLSVPHDAYVTDRLGVVKGLESIIRLNAGRWAPGPATITALRELVGVSAAVNDPAAGAEDPQASSPVQAVPLRDARIRRLALEALIAAGETDSAVIERGAADPDPQVRRLTMQAAGVSTGSRAEAAALALRGGRGDPYATVRMQALRGESARANGTPIVCEYLLEGTRDPDAQVALVALDLLKDCGASPAAVALLDYLVRDLPAAGSPRGWHRAAHALTALSRAAPARASEVLGQFTTSTTVPLRAYAARAAIALDDRVTLEKLASDANARVAEIASEGLGRLNPRPGADTGRPAQGSDINAADLQRFAAPRARVTIRGVGSFEVALFTSEAPATVLRFARLAEAGHYDGTTLVGVQPDLIGLTTRAGPGSAMRTETGSWPHVRGAVGIGPGGPETGGAEIFINLVDNPRFDHQYAVFAQVLNGIDVLDQILEDDVIERIEIVTGR